MSAISHLYDHPPAWEQRKVESIAEQFSGGGTPSTSNAELWSGDIPWIQSSDLTENELLGVVPRKHISSKAIATSATKLIPQNSIAVITRVGVGKLAFMPFSYASSQDFLSLSKLKLDGKFAAYSLYKKLQGELHQVQGTSIKGITKDELLAKSILTPCEEEQAEIGEFFYRLDRLITLHQRKYDKTVTLKKALLESMFPGPGEDRPRVRFAGFTDAWEQRKLGDLAEIVGGGTPSTQIAEYWDGNVDWYAPAEIGERIYLTCSRKKITELGLSESSARILPSGSVLFTSRAGIGNTAILAKPGATNQGFQSIIPRQGVLDSYFIFSRTHELKRYGEKFGAGSTFIEITGRQMEHMPLAMPSFREQLQIGGLFRDIDHLITLHQREPCGLVSVGIKSVRRSNA
ncbi:MAG: restriction endonuclease subunit S [Cellulomonadaceae bacterium]|jgi:type I restriction enzyme S subunit|nr:restriction endonuclease subunit S [Cellulomonadaceae bacterium]